jgi:shikimate kinase
MGETMNNIILCGFMGCGKSTVGKVLAQKLNTDFFDMDKYIENITDMFVIDIFENFGEPAFRKYESEAAEKLCAKNNIVIATGGGAVLKEENVNIFKASGKIVLIDVPLSVIKERLRDDKTRPLLTRADKDKVMLQLYVTRMPVYSNVADIIIDADNKPPEMIADEIIKLCRAG